MGLVVNSHVTRLGAFQPAGASGGQLLAEVTGTKPSDELHSRAERFVKGVLSDKSTRLLILTGDAGHGKTHLCRQVLAEYVDENELGSAIRSRSDGAHVLAVVDGRALRIIKDLSELSEEEGAERLARSVSDPDSVTIVCANEGRLRRAISLRGEELNPVRKSLDRVLLHGSTEAPGSGVHVLNLNYQSVATDTHESLVEQLFKRWIDDQRKWKSCDECDARTLCPIFENRRLLSGPEQRPTSRRAAIGALLRLAEQTGHVITIRELLIFLAHSVTGGLSCQQVHERVRRNPGEKNWQWRFLFHQAAFGDLLKESERTRLRVFAAAMRLDPGRFAVRPVDDALGTAAGNADEGWFVEASSGTGGTARTQRARRTQAVRHRDTIRFLRRRAFFDADATMDQVPIHFAERVGLRHYDAFVHLLRPDVPDKEKVEQRNRLLAGLEAIQGIRRKAGQSSLLVVDPAFASHRGAASVIERQVQLKDISLRSQTSHWETISGNHANLVTSVDWVDRKLFVVIANANGEEEAVSIELDCRQFELVTRAGLGMVSREFFQADIRRLMSQLALVAEAAPATSADITVWLRGQKRDLVIDAGNLIVAADA